jgi:hypothetical protein
MASTQDTKCPSCGIEGGPCATINGMPQYHIERLKAANPTTCEHPDCDECRRLKDTMINSQYSFRSYRPDIGSYSMKAKSRWPKGWREGSRELERAANLARARYELHLGTVHKGEADPRNVIRNLEIIMREGRLEP